MSFEIAIGERIAVPCEVIASPAASKFTWSFRSFHSSNSYTLPDVSANASTITGKNSHHQVTRDGNRSWLFYHPKSRQDFGSLSCSSVNEIGAQRKACIFNVYSASPPDPVRDCIVTSDSYDAAVISCLPGFDGGLKQSFVMEAYSLPDRQIVANMSQGEETVKFMIKSLTPRARYMFMIYSFNSKGKSGKTTMTYDHPADVHVSNDPASQHSSSAAAPSRSNGSNQIHSEAGSGAKSDQKGAAGQQLKHYLQMFRGSSSLLVILIMGAVVLPSVMLLFALFKIMRRRGLNKQASNEECKGSDADSNDFAMAARSIAVTAFAKANESSAEYSGDCGFNHQMSACHGINDQRDSMQMHQTQAAGNMISTYSGTHESPYEQQVAQIYQLLPAQQHPHQQEDQIYVAAGDPDLIPTNNRFLGALDLQPFLYAF